MNKGKFNRAGAARLFNLKSILAVFLGFFLMASSYSASKAQTSYCVDLDICHTGISNEGTGNEISVLFYADGIYRCKDTKKGVKENCKGADATFEVSCGIRPTSFKIVTNGEDGLFIDQISCYVRKSSAALDYVGVDNPLRTQVAEYGIDNGKGWCLSTDPKDAHGEWAGKCKTGCTSSLEFKFENSFDVKVKRYSLKLDVCHSDLENEGTKNQIKVEFLRGNTVVRTHVKNGVSANCYSFDEEFSCLTKDIITAARVTTNGDDGFYIDEASLFIDGDKQRQHGGDDGGGWCLSTDPSDSQRSWKGKCSGTGNSCWKSVTFDF